MKRQKNKITGLLEIYFNKYICAQKIYYKELQKIEKSLGVALDPIAQFKDDITNISIEYLITWGEFSFNEYHIYWNVTISEFDDFGDKTFYKGFIPVEWLNYNKAQIKEEVDKVVLDTIENNLNEIRRIFNKKTYRFEKKHEGLLEVEFSNRKKRLEGEEGVEDED